MSSELSIRDAEPEEFPALGALLVDVYSHQEGFPTPEEQPHYYELLADIGRFTEKPGARVLVAHNEDGALVGGVVYFADMSSYGSGGIATSIRNASGIRLLGVDSRFRGLGAGRALTMACIDLARTAGHAEVILHTTRVQKIAWGMYERIGFHRSEDLDFAQEELQVFGFRLAL